jgi:hypothetical protein
MLIFNKKTTRKSCMLLLIIVGISLNALIFPVLVSHTNASTDWIIEPGRGWGPVSINMSEQQIISILGQPTRTTYGNTIPKDLFKSLHFASSVLMFKKNKMDNQYKLYGIVIRDNKSSTKEGIKLGSSIFEVVKIFGDTMKADIAATKGSTGKTILRGMELSITTVSEGQDIYVSSPDTLLLNTDYINIGISFNFAIDKKKPSTPKIEFITVKEIQSCKEY